MFLIPALLVFIAQISPESCFLMPNGNWKGPMEYAQSFTDVKLNCLAVIASQTPVYVNDFTKFSEIFSGSWRRVKRQDIPNKGSSMPVKHRNGRSNCVTSYSRKSMASRASAHTTSHTPETNSDFFFSFTAEEDIESIENWPIDNENARKAATELKKNHRIIPLPAYDIHGNLIHPTR
ncbi:hypothetical protein B0H14DRAFT_2576974 [Mycena olivaceomarginata]|nr:hypothetical protein B0H14DRAFT_2576974 [Mycena olivaceomarginata]